MRELTQKNVRLTEVLEQRILHGDYDIRELPTEDELAQEVGVSRRTARRVLLQLVDRGLLVRKPHGRVEVNRESAQLSGQLRLAFLSPAFSSPDFEAWRARVTCAAKESGAMVRAVDFVHWNDPVILQTLTSFDGVFLVPSSEPMPQELIERFSQAGNLVVLDADMTDHGVPSIEFVRPMFVDMLADHLYQLGHRTIYCLNTQPHDDVIRRRIEQWQLWQKLHRVEGRLVDAPVEPYQHHLAKAREVVSGLVAAHDFSATGMICLTNVAAIGAVRALHDHGLAVGKDVSVCAMPSVGDYELMRHLVPSQTSVQLPDPKRYIELCIEWFAKRGTPWVGSLLIQPTNVSLFVGESTGPAPTRLPVEG